jgi:2-polyprenyl-3-methyl-5-hydroxy-6-metoxy-1,4-benzoquinol methylase
MSPAGGATPVLILEAVSCELCGSASHEKVLVENGAWNQALQLVRCTSCNLVFTNPRPTSESIGLLYSAENYASHTASAEYCLTGEASKNQFQLGLRSLAAIQGPPVRLIDVGCGTGHFLEMAARQDGWAVSGVEISEFAAAEAARLAGCSVHAGTLESAQFPACSFDTATLWYILEHADHPKALLAEVHRIVRPEGLVLIAVPNLRYLLLKSRLLRRLGRDARVMHLGEHLFQYTEETLAKLLRATGFEIILEQVAAPFDRGSWLRSVAKKLAAHALRLIHFLTGRNFGGLLLIARRKPLVSSN